MKLTAIVRRPKRTGLLAAGIVVLLGITAAGRGAPASSAQTCASCLGPPTNLAEFYAPLGLWKRIQLSLIHI